MIWPLLCPCLEGENIIFSQRSLINTPPEIAKINDLICRVSDRARACQCRMLRAQWLGPFLQCYNVHSNFVSLLLIFNGRYLSVNIWWSIVPANYSKTGKSWAVIWNCSFFSFWIISAGFSCNWCGCKLNEISILIATSGSHRPSFIFQSANLIPETDN